MKHFFSFLSLFLLFNITTAMDAQPGLKKANKEYELQAYNLAVPNYVKFLQKHPENTEALVKLADCYYHLNYFMDAERYFKEAFQKEDADSYQTYLINYAKAMQSQGKYDFATSLFKQYAAVNPAVGNHYAESCIAANNLIKTHSDLNVRNEYANSVDADFGPAFFKDKVIFTSAKNTAGSGWDDNITNRLYQTTEDKNRYLEVPKLLRRTIAEAKNEGPISYSADGKWVAYTKNNFTSGIRQVSGSGINLSLFIAEVMPNGDWKNEKAFAYNGSGFSTGFPCFTDNGNTLYFASDRPEAVGGFDIFISKKSGSTWTTPQNAGNTINTPGNEVTPFYESGALFFASDWHFGLGGLDIFKANGVGTSFSNVTNLNNGVNSGYDDYGFIFNPSKSIGYFTSNRKGGKGKEDIYRLTGSTSLFSNNTPTILATTAATSAPTTTWKQPTKPAASEEFASKSMPQSMQTTTTAVNHKLTIIVKDAATGKPIPNAKVNLTDCGETGSFQTDANGRFGTSELAKMPCDLIIEPEGYTPLNIYYQRFGEQPEEFEVALTRAGQTAMPIAASATTGQPAPATESAPAYIPPPVVTTTPTAPAATRSYTGNIVNVVNKQPVAEVQVFATNKNKFQKLETKTDPYGNYYLSLDTDASYDIMITKEGFATTNNIVETSQKSGDNLGVMEIEPTGGEVAYTPSAADIEKAQARATPIPTISKPTTTTTTTAPAPAKTYTPPAAISKEGKFSIQLAAVKGNSRMDVKPYEKLTSIGDLHQTFEKGYTKLRLGYFASESAAKTALNTATKRGFKDAIVIQESDGPSSYSASKPLPKTSTATKPATKPAKTKATTSKPKSKTTKYKIRLASLTKPENFKPSTVNRFGTIEKVKKDNFTIFLLSGYTSKASARDALGRAKKAGFPDAQLVIDNNGNLTPIK